MTSTSNGCRDFRRLIHDASDGGCITPALSRHLAGCPSCAELARELRELDLVLRRTEELPPEELTAGILADWDATHAPVASSASARVPPRSWGARSWALTFAVVLLVSMGAPRLPEPGQLGLDQPAEMLSMFIPAVPALPMPDAAPLSKALEPFLLVTASAAASLFALPGDLSLPCPIGSDPTSLITFLFFVAAGLMIPGSLRAAPILPGRRMS